METPASRHGAFLRRYFAPRRRQLTLLSLLVVLHIGFQLLAPQLLRSFIDLASSETPLRSLLARALTYVGVVTLGYALSTANAYLGQSIGWSATNDLRSDLVGHCLGLDLAFHQRSSPGELVERIDDDSTALGSFFSDLFVHLGTNLLLIVGVLVLLFREDVRVGLGLSLFVLIGFATLVRLHGIGVPHFTKWRQVAASVYGFVGEANAAAEDVSTNGAGGYVMRRFLTFMGSWLPVRVKARLATAGLWSANIALFAIGNAIAFGLGGWLHARGAITIGTVYLIFNYTQLLYRPLEQLRGQVSDLQEASASLGRTEELLGTHSALRQGTGARLPLGVLGVSFRDVSFSYGSDDAAVSCLSLEVAPGRVLGLIGRTGSGKSTIARLLLRFYDPTSGSIALGGVDTAEVSPGHVRERVGLVSQEVQLFRASVRDNLTFFDRAVPDERLTRTLSELGLGAWLEALPEGLDTELAAGGVGLSAGQEQLLALARAFLADPGLVILDEASSRLDPATERQIEAAISRLLAGRTAIIIAHRLSSLDRADEVAVLDEGHLLEHGGRAALAGDPGSHYHQLLALGGEEVLS